MVRYQPYYTFIRVGDVSQVASTVQRMKPGLGQVGRIADVMEESGSLQEVGVRTEDRGD
jgi:hypothetical protein